MSNLRKALPLLAFSIFFTVFTEAGNDLYKLVKDITPGAGGSASNLISVNGIVYFTADDGINGNELWRSNGTPAGTALVKDIYPGSATSFVQHLTNMNGMLYFTADDGTHGNELWISDGTETGTVLVKDIYPGAASSSPTTFSIINGLLYFSANDSLHGSELWKTDGTLGGTAMLKDINPGSNGWDVYEIANVNGEIFFQADDGIHGYELWKSDGTAAGTMMVKDIGPGSSHPSNLLMTGSLLVFGAGDGIHGYELWRTDGTDAGTALVKDIYPGPNGSSIQALGNVNGIAYFYADDSLHGSELWRSDGTSFGTAMVKDINSGLPSSSPQILTSVSGLLYFTADDGIHGYELWKSDGTASGTSLVKDIFPGSNGSYAAALGINKGALYLRASDDIHGFELWRSDGTSNGTTLVKDINPGTSSSNIPSAIVVDSTLYFYADDGTHGYELWRSFPRNYGAGKFKSIADVRNDQGGQVRVRWDRSIWDTTEATSKIVFYSLWRRIPLNLMKGGYIGKKLTDILLDDTLVHYDALMTIPAVQIPEYNVVAPTLADSGSGGIPWFHYLLVAHTPDPYEYYISLEDSGYSVDNLAPIPPAGLVASVQAGPQVKLSWNSPTDLDVKSYTIYRSTTSGFTPAPGNTIGTSASTSFTDASPVAGVPSYYRIIAVDLHDNQSPPSSEAQARVSVIQQFSVQDKWNMVSVPLIVSDFTKTGLFPTATSNAFAFSGAYVRRDTLINGSGYWLKFSGAQDVNISGLQLPLVTVNVQPGWNMIGSVSKPIAAATINSHPGAIVTSQFFGYDGHYTVADSIRPGNAYWVKVSEGGMLILTSGPLPPGEKRIRIVPTSELPPQLPAETNAHPTSHIPHQFSLDQNYPNPFNPATRINYALPVSEHVRLSVYNMLGQEVASLVDEVQEAGYKTVSFDASRLPSGMYTYKITAGTFTDVKKMLLLK